MEEFGNGRVNRGDYNNETFKREDGVCGDQRLVILSPPSPHWTEVRKKFPQWWEKPAKP